MNRVLLDQLLALTQNTDLNETFKTQSTEAQEAIIQISYDQVEKQILIRSQGSLPHRDSPPKIEIKAEPPVYDDSRREMKKEWARELRQKRKRGEL